MLVTSDLALVKSEGPRRAVGQFAPKGQGKKLLLGGWLEGGKVLNIPDPFRRSDEAFDTLTSYWKRVPTAGLSVCRLGASRRDLFRHEYTTTLMITQSHIDSHDRENNSHSY